MGEALTSRLSRFNSYVVESAFIKYIRTEFLTFFPQNFILTSFNLSFVTTASFDFKYCMSESKAIPKCFQKSGKKLDAIIKIKISINGSVIFPLQKNVRNCLAHFCCAFI